MKTLRVGILVFNDFEPLDVWGFIEAFSLSRFKDQNYYDPPPYPFEVFFISNEKNPGSPGAIPKAVKSYNGPKVAPDYFANDALKEHIDVFMIPGGLGTREILENKDQSDVEEFVSWLKEMDKRVLIMSSVCTGAAIYARAGLLDGLPATTNRQAFDWVETFGPKVLWDKKRRWVDAGKYVTSAGVSAGTDMAFYLVSRLVGNEIAETTVLAAEYDWQRDPLK